jgi:hypothetical protein
VCWRVQHLDFDFYSILSILISPSRYFHEQPIPLSDQLCEKKMKKRLMFYSGLLMNNYFEETREI